MTYLPFLLGGDLNAYSTARAFYLAGAKKSHLFCREKLSISSTSRFAICHVSDRLDEPEICLRTLTEIADRIDRKETRFLIVPCGDRYVETLENIRDKLDSRFAFFIPSRKLFYTVSDKAEFYKFLDGFGIPYPETKVLSSPRIAQEDTVSYPCVLKPSDSAEYWRHPFPEMRKVYFPKSREETERLAGRIFSSGYRGTLVMQEKIESKHGSESMRVLTTFSGQDAKVLRAVYADVLLGECGRRALGNHAAILTRPLDALCFSLIAFLEKIGYVGIAKFDIVTDGSGRAYVLELNPRQGRSNDYVRAAGVNLTSLLLNEAHGKTQSPDFAYSGIYWRSLPDSVFFKNAQDPSLILEAERMLCEGRFSSPFDERADLVDNPARRVYLFLHDIRQKQRFAKSKEDAPCC